MKWFLGVLVLILVKDACSEFYCPSLCICKSNNYKPAEGTVTLAVESSDLLKLKCGGGDNPMSELKEIDLNNISNVIVALNLSGNAISTLSRDLHLPALQKLDLSHNQISLIETDAFYNLTSLQRLDLSHNLITAVDREVFKGLVKLERLQLSHNRITALPSNTFEHLVMLRQLDVSENPLVCECTLAWLGEWARDGRKLLGSPRCAGRDPALRLRRLKIALECADTPRPDLLLAPHADQVVFEGDSLILRCRITTDTSNDSIDLKWVHPRLEICDVNVTSARLERAVETTVWVGNVTAQHEGAWTCRYSDNTTAATATTATTGSTATATERTLRVTVMGPRTLYCNATVTVDNKGAAGWPLTLAGREAKIACPADIPANDTPSADIPSADTPATAAPAADTPAADTPAADEGGVVGATASRRCHSNGTWAPAVTTACPYINPITKTLQQFALLNASGGAGGGAGAGEGSVGAARRLSSYVLEHAADPRAGAIADPDDVTLIADAVEAYMTHLATDDALGGALLDVISATMRVGAEIMAAAEKASQACTRLLRAAETLALYTRNAEGHKSNMAVQAVRVRAGLGGGVTCVWYSERGAPAAPGAASAAPAAGSGAPSSPRRLRCATTNHTLGPLISGADNVVHATLQIPSTLLYHVGETAVNIASQDGYQLLVCAYADGSLLPLLPERDARHPHRARDYYGRSTRREDINTEVTSPVVGLTLVNVSMERRLVEPVYVMVRAGGGGAGGEPRAAVWDAASRTWANHTADFVISHVVGEMVVIKCYRLGYVAVLQSVETGFYGGRVDGARFKFSHPAVYVGSLILLGCAAAAAATYLVSYPYIQMPRRAKHAHINTWTAICLLTFMYTFGIYQTEDVKLCQVVGLLLHYLSLSCLLWMVVTASNMYKWLSRTQSPVNSPDDELPPDVPMQKPILGLYLVGWGISLIVCGISGAVNLKDYAAYSQCFLSTAPSLIALFIPAGILLLFIAVLFLLIRCRIRNVNIQLSEGTQATDNVDLDMWEPVVSQERRSIKSTDDSEVEDVEHTAITQLRAQVIVVALYVCVWCCAAVAVYRPLPEYLPYQEDICSIVYAVCATVLGTFILFFYGIARSDVRAQWALMHCRVKKTLPANRGRTTPDVVRKPGANNRASVAASIPLNIDNRSRSGSRSSNRTISKTSNSGNYRAAAELNGQTLPKTKNKLNNGRDRGGINLVDLHRQYASNNVMAFETAMPDPKIFYNENQINVAKKFFKKQRQNMKRNIIELPRRDIDSDSHASLPLPSKSNYNGVANIINAGSKVRNTNIHVEKDQHSDGGVKSTRHRRNPNILDEDAPIKRYSTDSRKSWNGRDVKNRNHMMNIYTNVPETMMPQHQVSDKKIANSVSEECLQSHDSEQPEMRTISQQCSLEYSSASEAAMPQTYSDQTLNNSEITSHETHSAMCSANEITDTESFGQYIDYLHPKNEKQDKADNLDKSLQDISEECTANSSDEINRCSTPHGEAGELETLLEKSTENLHKAEDSKSEKEYFLPKTYDFETCSTNTSDQNFENESDIYYPNYQMSEVSIRSHGLYAPSPSYMCPNEISFSSEDVSNVERQYVNYDPNWRKTIKSNPKFVPTSSCPNVNRDNDSPVSFVSELDELYTQITSNKDRKPRKVEPAALDVTVNSDVTLKPCDSDSCVSEAVSDVDFKGETAV